MVAPSDTEDWPLRFAAYAFDVTLGYSGLSEDDQQTCRDAAEWARQRVSEALSSQRGAPRPYTDWDVEICHEAADQLKMSDREPLTPDIQHQLRDLANRLSAGLPEEKK